jgi:ABC-2 type transport system permease protein
MNKFWAVVKREYVQRVRSKMFLVVTIGAPLMFALFTVVPAMIAGIKSGGPLRLAVVDETGRMYERVSQSLRGGRDEGEDETEDGGTIARNAANANSSERVERAAKAMDQGYAVEQVPLGGRTTAEVIGQLDERVRKAQKDEDHLDAYLILPKDILEKGEALYFARNVGDVFTRGQIKDRLTTALRDTRLAEHNITPAQMRELNRPVKLTARGGGGEEDKGQGFYLVFGVGFVIYLTILMYGQVILGAVIEEKETRIAEILFSSIRSFPLMMGKLIGVSLVALTQLAIWGLAFAAFALYGVAMLAAQGMKINFPHIPASVFAYLVLFFLLGYFIYATLYALVGSMVTTSQEGGQLAMPIILMLVIGFYFVIPVIRSPNSPLAFWVSMIPFFSPIIMLVRIVTQTPPFWQIALSLGIGFATVALLIWVAGRVYRVGMLMYGKRATIPEMLKWVRQA